MFEWDEGKSQWNLRERGLGFDTASEIFKGPVLEFEDRRRDYGERRIIAVGEHKGRFLAVVYTWRGERRRIISARRANRRECNAYRTEIARGSGEA